MSIAEDTLRADQCLQLRRDIVALRHALTRSQDALQAERLARVDAEFKFNQFKFALLKMAKEVS